jgi:hypothetical protein
MFFLRQTRGPLKDVQEHRLQLKQCVACLLLLAVVGADWLMVIAISRLNDPLWSANCLPAPRPQGKPLDPREPFHCRVVPPRSLTRFTTPLSPGPEQISIILRLGA